MFATLLLLIILAVSCLPSSDENSAPAGSENNGPSAEGNGSDNAGADPDAPLALGQPFKTKKGLVITPTVLEPYTEEFMGDGACADITLTNEGDKPVPFSGFWDWQIQTPNGVIKSMDYTAMNKPVLESGDLAPGGNVSGSVCVEDVGPGEYQLIYEPRLSFSSESAKWSVTL